MLRKKVYLVGYVLIIALALFFVFPVGQARASSLYLSPSSVSQNPGQTFSASVRISTDGNAVNAAQGSIIFDKEKLEVVFISKSGSIFNLWTQEPTYSNSEGTINFEGGIPNPGYSGSSGLILTVTFKTKTTTVRDATSVTLVSGAILANDGQGTNVLTSLGSLSVTINPTVDTNTQPKVTPEVTPEITVSGAPKVESSTHSDSTKWYSNNSPTFTWTLPLSVTGVSYLITDKATSNPGPKSDGVISKATFTGISDGTQYFNIKFKQGATWGPIAHYQFNIDTVPPIGFEIRSVTSTGDDTQPQIAFETTDALSGIDHYEIKVGDNGSWITVATDQAGKPYRLSFDKTGTQTVFVKAVDKASNATTESISLTTTGSAAGSALGTWVAKLFDGIVNTLSNYGLLIALLIAIIGILMLVYKLLGIGIDKLWHQIKNRRVIRKTERKIDSTLDRILDDMKNEIKFLETIGKHRPLGYEEKYLKSKLQQYIKDLKNSGR